MNSNSTLVYKTLSESPDISWWIIVGFLTFVFLIYRFVIMKKTNRFTNNRNSNSIFAKIIVRGNGFRIIEISRGNHEALFIESSSGLQQINFTNSINDDELNARHAEVGVFENE